MKAGGCREGWPKLEQELVRSKEEGTVVQGRGRPMRLQGVRKKRPGCIGRAGEAIVYSEADGFRQCTGGGQRRYSDTKVVNWRWTGTVWIKRSPNAPCIRSDQ